MTLDYPSSGWGWDMQLGRYQSTPMVLVAANQVYPLGQVMDGALAYQTSNSIAYHNYSTSTGVWVSGGPWVNQSGYAGLKVVHGGQTYYGWAEVSETWNPDSGPYGSAGIHVQRWGMETNPNVSIVAGQTADPLLAGDADMNGKVEFTDYLALETHFGRSGVNWTGGDFNNDGKVTFQDYLLLEQNFAKAVPEPATISLLVLASFGLLRRR
jgi:hypothetical protein